MSLVGIDLGYYHPLQHIGSGGMGEVYLAEDRRLGRQVALKVIRTDALLSSEQTIQDAVRLFRREAIVIAKLNHPSILPLFDIGEELVRGVPLTYLVMPFCQEGSFAKWLQQESSLSLSVQENAVMLDQMADALQYAHDQKIIHRDVKPANFLIRSRRGSKLPDLLLTDFGIASVIATTGTSNISHVIRGTPTYMAPEQWSGQPLPATDQYALAIIIYQLLTGHSPFEGNEAQVMYQHLNVVPQPPSSIRPQISKYVDDVVLQALSKKPEERFPSVSVFAQKFHQASQVVQLTATKIVMGRESIHTLKIEETEKSNATKGLRPKKHQSMAILIGLLLIFLLASSVVYLVTNNVTESNKRVSAQSTTEAISNATETAVSALATSEAKVTAEANPNPYPNTPSGATLAFYDPLQSDTNENWTSENGTNGICKATQKSYNAISVNKGYYHYCNHVTEYTSYTNFIFQVQMMIISGYAGGILFRSSSDGDYVFDVGYNGSYDLILHHKKDPVATLAEGRSSAINTGIGQSNLIAIVAFGDTLDLYVNNTLVAHVNNNSSNSGGIGVVADQYDTPTEVHYTEARLWTW